MAYTYNPMENPAAVNPGATADAIFDIQAKVANNLQAIKSARQKHEQERQMFDLEKRKKELEMETLASQNQLTSMQRKMMEDALKADTSSQKKVLDAKQTLIDQEEHDNTMKLKEINSAGEALAQRVAAQQAQRVPNIPMGGQFVGQEQAPMGAMEAAKAKFNKFAPPGMELNPAWMVGMANDQWVKSHVQDDLKAKREERMTRQNELGNANKLRSEFNGSQIKKDFDEINRSYKGIESAYKRSTNKDTKSLVASDQALVMLFQKMLDPGSVVREGEFDRMGYLAPMYSKVESFLPKLMKGGVAMTNRDRMEALKVAKDLMDVGGENYNQHYDRYKEIAGEYGIKDSLIFGGAKRYGDGAASESKASSAVPSSNEVLVMSPDGRRGYIPQEDLEQALAEGYKQIGE